jgi:hypothetical protein
LLSAGKAINSDSFVNPGGADTADAGQALPAAWVGLGSSPDHTQSQGI